MLLCQRAVGRSQAGLWEFPGGKVHGGELCEVALVRELFEELGCDVIVGERLSAVVHAYEEFTVRLVPFICRLAAESDPPQDLEHSEIKWLELGEVSSYPLAPADVPVLNELLARERI